MIEASEKERSLENAGKTRAVIRQIAAAFRQVEDFEPFVRGLEAALGQAEFFDRAAIALFPRLGQGEEKVAHFPDGTLSLPLSGSEGVAGMVNFANHRHPLGPEDLHLMAGLGELLTVLVEHALRYGDQRRNLTLLGFLLNQAPVGVACFDTAGNILVSNTLGRRLLGINSSDGRPWVLSEEWALEVRNAAGTGAFHRHTGGQLLHVQVKAVSSEAEHGITALVIADLTQEQEKFREILARETYRCGWLNRPLSLAVLTGPNPGELMDVLRPLRERLGAAVFAGPCDSDAVGLIFPETTFAVAMEKVRGVRSLLQGDWEAGLAVTSRDLDNPEALFASAAAARRRVGDFLKQSLLLHDDYPSVNDMLELVLRDEFCVRKSSDFQATIRYLRTGHFDGFFSEIDLSNGISALDLARIARETNPDIRPFFTSCAATSRRADPRFHHEVVFQKPFDVREVVNRVKEAFA